MLGLVAARGKRDRSRIIRQIVDREATIWLDSPYVSLRTDCFFFVTAERDIFYHQRDLLRLQRPRVKLPMSLAMKPEKVEDFLAAEANDLNRLRDRWIANHFSVRLDEDSSPLIEKVDRIGGVRKSADLWIDQPQDLTLWSETFCGIREYVQCRDEGDNAEDRGACLIRMPTLDLHISVMVDQAIYTRAEQDASGVALDYEFRNLDSAKLTNKKIDSYDQPLLWSENRFPELKYDSKEAVASHRAVRDAFRRFMLRTRYLLDDQDGPYVEPQHRSTLEALAEPNAYLYGTLDWQMPPIGFEVCVTWNKPHRKTPL